MTPANRLSRWQLGALLCLAIVLLAGLVAAVRGCGASDMRRVITIWHPFRPTERTLLYEEFRRFELEHPDVRLRALYKDVEELRSAFQAAALAGSGPDLVYGPSDVLDTYQSMGLLQDMGPWFTDEQRTEFI